MNLNFGSTIGSLRIRRELSKASSTVADIYERLSSGQRINKASDDAAGLSLASLLGASTRVVSQGVRNLNDAISAVNVAGTALDALSSLAQRVAEIAEQGANGTYSTVQRTAMQREVDALVAEYNRVSTSTQFNGSNLLSTSFHAQGGVGVQNALLVDTNGSSNSLTLTSSSTVGAAPLAQYGNTITGIPDGFDVKAAFINNDSYADLVVTAPNSGSGESYIYLGNGNGTFLAPISHQTYGAHGLALADVSGDNKVDIVFTTYDGYLGVALGNGDGTFQDDQIIPNLVGAGHDFVMLGDVDGDGDLDAVTANEINNKVSVFTGNGNGTFNAGRTYTSGAQNGYAEFGSLVDINGDNRKDFVFAFEGTVGSGAGIVLYANSDGSFTAPVTITSMGNRPYQSLATADVDGDGDIDLIAGHEEGSILFLGNGNGTFNTGVTLTDTGAGGIWQLIATDYSNDGKVDLIGYRDARLYYQLGNGDGTFLAPLSISAGGTPDRAGVVFDLNNDGVDEYILPYRAWPGTASIRAFALATTTAVTTYSSAGALTLSSINVSTQSASSQSLITMQNTLEILEYRRGQLGATEARLEIFVSSLQTTEANYKLAHSRVTEIDVANEVANLVKQEIIQDSASALLAQANQSAEVVLSLLK